MGLTGLKILVALVAVIGLIGIGGFFLGQTFTGNFVSSSSGVGVQGVHVGMACVEVYRADGTRENLGCSHNTYTNAGMNATRYYLFTKQAADAPSPYSVIGVGQINRSQIATDRCLANGTGAGANCQEWYGNGLNPAAGTVAEVTGSPADFGNVSITKTFTCSPCTNVLVNGTSIYNTTFASDT